MLWTYYLFWKTFQSLFTLYNGSVISLNIEKISTSLGKLIKNWSKNYFFLSFIVIWLFLSVSEYFSSRKSSCLWTGGYRVFDLKRKLVGKKTDLGCACTKVYAEVDIQRTLALEESKETFIRGFRLQTLRCNSDTREKHVRPCIFEEIWFSQAVREKEW